MRIAGLFLLCSLAATAQDVWRIFDITYIPKEDKLCWSIAQGKLVDGEFQFGRLLPQMCIYFGDSSMVVDGERRWFLTEETDNMAPLFSDLKMYIAESSIWWDRGKGFNSPAERDQAESGGKSRPKARTIRAKR